MDKENYDGKDARLCPFCNTTFSTDADKCLSAALARIVQLESEILALNATLQGKDDARAELESQLLDLTNQRDEGETRERMLTADVALKDARIAALEAQLREREIEAAECKRWKAAAESAEAKLEAAVVMLNREHISRCEPDVCQHVAALAAARAENEEHRKALAAIYLALGTGNPDRDTWPDAIAALRAQLAAAEERERDHNCFNNDEVAERITEVEQWANDLAHDLSAARAENERMRKIVPVVDLDKAGEPTPLLLELAEKYRRARPDDAGRVERGKTMKETMEQIFHWVIVDGMDLQDALTRILAAADGEVKP